MYQSLQGIVRFGLRLPSGKPGAMWDVGNVPDATLQMQTQSTTKNESRTGQRLPALILFTGKSGAFNLTLDEWNTKNLEQAFYGVSSPTVAGTVTGEAFPAGLLAGDQVRLAKPYASALVLTDSAGSPVTVTSTKYKLTGHNDRVVEMLDVATYTQPFKAAYSYDDFESVEAFAALPRELYVQFDGIDTVTNVPVTVDLYRVQFSPVQNLGLIHQTDTGPLPLQGSILYDELNDDGTSANAGFFKFLRKTAA